MILLIFLVTIEARKLIFCPNMGRYGNQLDQYVSMMYLADKVDRQLVLTPLIGKG